MDKEVISFKDFLSSKGDKLEQDIIDFDINPTHVEESNQFEIDDNRLNYLINDFGIDLEEIENLKSLEEESSDEFYRLYKDINESFSCDIFIEGANPSKSSARLIIESNDWNIVFNGQIEDGKCIVPIKKLDILSENSTGNIKLEIIAEGSVFVPWEAKFLVKSSKTISTVNEKLDKIVDVKVGRIR